MAPTQSLSPGPVQGQKGEVAPGPTFHVPIPGAVAILSPLCPPQGARLHALHHRGLLLLVVPAPLHQPSRPLVHDLLLPIPGPGHGKQVAPTSWAWTPGIQSLASGHSEVCVSGIGVQEGPTTGTCSPVPGPLAPPTHWALGWVSPPAPLPFTPGLRESLGTASLAGGGLG